MRQGPGDLWGDEAFLVPGEPGRRPLLIGLTGGIGSGKTAVAGMLAELGAAVVDADAIAREVVEPGEPALARIVAAFGPGVLDEQGRLDRRRLGRLVFRDAEARRRLESIIHPAVRARTRDRIRRLAETGVYPAIVWDVPLLFEVGAEGLVDEVWVVVAPREQRLARLRRRDPDLSPEQLEQRMAAQIPLEEKAARADVVIDNSGPLEETRRRVRQAWQERLARWRALASGDRGDGGTGTGR
ncbi:MAG TPA: dephospho-CoA kinase [Thermaerobacter sp.]